MFEGYADQSGLIRLSWDDVMQMCKQLAKETKEDFDPEVVVGIAKGGVIPATIVASMLRVEFYPIRLSRRIRERLIRQVPEVIVPLTEDVEGKRTLIVDEMSVTGETLKMAVSEAKRKGAKRVKTATLYIHPDSFRPTWYCFETESLVIPPWDFEVLDGGEFVIRPEYLSKMERLE